MFITKVSILLWAFCLVVDGQNKQLLKPQGRTLYSFDQESFFRLTELGYRNLPLNLFFDTGAVESWVVSTNCEEPRCERHARYNHSLSPTHRALNLDQEVNYGSLGIVRGQLYRDCLYLADTPVNRFRFVGAENLPDEEVLPPGLDGIIGVDLETFQNDAIYKNPVKLMTEQGALPEAILTLYVNRANDYQQVVLFGAILPQFTRGPIIYFPLTHSDKWQFHLEEIALRVGNDHDAIAVCLGGCEAIVSTGLPVILGPSDEVRRLNNWIGATRTGDGRFVLPSCDLSQLPNLVIKTSAREFVATPDEYVVQVSENPNICVSGIFEGSESAWVLGQNFLSSYFTVYDYANRRVGFAQPAEDDESA